VNGFHQSLRGRAFPLMFSQTPSDRSGMSVMSMGNPRCNSVRHNYYQREGGEDRASARNATAGRGGAPEWSTPGAAGDCLDGSVAGSKLGVAALCRSGLTVNCVRDRARAQRSLLSQHGAADFPSAYFPARKPDSCHNRRCNYRFPLPGEHVPPAGTNLRRVRHLHSISSVWHGCFGILPAQVPRLR